MLKLDFTIQSSDDRNAFVSKFFAANPKYKPTPHELETLTNYILYGKDADGTSVVDRHEVEIETKYGSYAKRKPESLEGLAENPDQEGAPYEVGLSKLGEGDAAIYKRPKPRIDRERDGDIPGMRELWEVIDRLEMILLAAEGNDEARAQLEQEGPMRAFTTTDVYRMRHYLIDLRKQQYVLKEAVGRSGRTYSPSVKHAAPEGAAERAQFEWEGYWFGPLGLVDMPRDGRFEHPAEAQRLVTVWDRRHAEGMPDRCVDFTNPDHIYLLAKAWQDLAIQREQDPEAVSDGILKTLEFYADRANLEEAHRIIWDGKVKQLSNEAIKMRLEKIGKNYSCNYISTIFKKNVCADIAVAAKLHGDYFFNRDDDSAWKVCRVCGKRKLRDSREFVRKTKSTDGLSNRCKECDKAARRLKKGGIEGK